MQDAAAIKSTGKWRAVQFAAVTLCVLLYAPRFSVPTTDLLAPARRRDEEKKDGGALDLENQVGSPAAAAFLGPRVGVGPVVYLDNQVGSPCSSMPAHAICCDRSDDNADVCFMSGDVRTDAASLSLLLFPPTPAASGATTTGQEEERIRPYTRKWDNKTMATIHEVRLRAARPEDEAAAHRCDVRHGAPAHVVTGAGGYNGGNYFHAFNDGLLPAWLTAQHLRRRVVLAVLAYDEGWAGRYAEVIAGLSEHPVVDLLGDNRTHCFPGAIVGTRFHGFLAVDAARLRDNKTVVDFHDFLAAAYGPSPSSRGIRKQAETGQKQRWRPRLGIVSRVGTRVIENEAAVARLAESVGFDVDILPANKATAPPLAATRAAVSALDALLGVHGSDLTSFLFLRPGRGAALVQVAPFGIAELSRDAFGAPAERMGLRYEQYNVRASESSLSRVYAADDAVVADPQRARLKQGSGKDWDWEFIGRVYVNGQNVSLDLARFGETLARVHSWLLEPQQEIGSA